MPATSQSPARVREELISNLMALPAAAGLILAVVAFFRRGSGIDGTPGAALAIFGMTALVLASLLVGRIAPGGLRTFITVMLLIGGILTLICAWFLMQGWIMLAVALTLSLWLIFILVAR